MTQSQETGKEAHDFGKRMAIIVAQHIGATTCGAEGNEFVWNGKPITIRSAHRNTAYVGVLYSMLERIETVLAALETETIDEFQVWEMDRASYLEISKAQIKNPLIAQAPTKVFPKKGKLVAKVKDQL